LSCIAANAQTPFTCKGQYYLSLTKNGSLNSGLYEVKIDNLGQKIYLDTISSGIGLRLNAMGYRITDNFIYGMDPNSAVLSKVGSDGVAIALGIPKGIPLSPVYYAGDVTPDGKYLLLIGLGGVNPQIVKVDLNDPEYSCSFIPLKDPTSVVVDIAFDPFSGILYGHDLRNKKMVTINPETGDVNSNFIVQPLVDQLGALFFDSFGNLYGYGAYGSTTQDKFVAINKKTGEIRLLAAGPLSSGQDGCSCPYTLELQKTVVPNITYPCTEVVYNFIISNGSGALRIGVMLSDTMPISFNPKQIVRNPFGGDITFNGHILNINNMIVPPGIDTIKVLVEIGPNALGLYMNQAVLSGLPAALGSFTVSDDPFTLIEKDSTELLVKPFDLSFLAIDFKTCPGDSVFIDASLYGIQYKWSDGDTSPKKWISSPSEITMKASSLCETKIIDFSVSNDLATVNIVPDSIIIDLGDQVFIVSEYQNIDNKVIFEWKAENNEYIDCTSCKDIYLTPLFSGFFTLQMTNDQGCVVFDKVYIRVKKDRSIYSPNIISANRDGNNDVFFLSGNAKNARGQFLKIYDRWGNLIFNSGSFDLNEASFGWDGRFKEKHVVSGVYTWVASLSYIDGHVDTIKGDVTVIK
jgi:gliding motility-associated-like protein